MGRKQQISFTPHADVRWFGEPPDGFKETAESIIGRKLDEEAWGGLCSVIRGYSFQLNHELVAAPLTEQKKVVRGLLSATDDLLEAIDRADQMDVGVVVRNRLPDSWEAVYPHEAFHDSEVRKMRADLVTVYGAYHPAAEEQADRLISDWKRSGKIVSPSYPADFLVLLGQFREAVATFSAGLKNGKEYHSMSGEAWMGFIGMLTDWAKENGVSQFVSKDIDRGASKFLELTKAILALVPELRDDNGDLEQKQMRRPIVADTTLAEQILDARQQYDSFRPQPGEISSPPGA